MTMPNPLDEPAAYVRPTPLTDFASLWWDADLLRVLDAGRLLVLAHGPWDYRAKFALKLLDIAVPRSRGMGVVPAEEHAESLRAVGALGAILAVPNTRLLVRTVARNGSRGWDGQARAVRLDVGGPQAFVGLADLLVAQGLACRSDGQSLTWVSHGRWKKHLVGGGEVLVNAEGATL